MITGAINFIGRAGTPNSICAHSSKQCRWTSCVARRESWYGKIWAHILAYNHIRTIIAQAANKRRLEPRTISFKGAIQALEAFQLLIATQGDYRSTQRQRFFEQLLDAVATL